MVPIDLSSMTWNDIFNYGFFCFEKAKSQIETAYICAKNKQWDATITHAYYACLHAGRALLVLKRKSPTTHQGVKTQIALDFIKTGQLDKSYGKILGELLNMRMEADYDPLSAFSEKEALKALKDACLFCLEAANLFNSISEKKIKNNTKQFFADIAKAFL